MSNLGESKKLKKYEFYKCPFPHMHPRHKQAFFKSFAKHFRIFSNRDDHFAIIQLHEEIIWNLKRSAAEKGENIDENVSKISHKAWFEAIKKRTGRSIQVVKK
jgi:hypothetical protein